MCIIQKQGSPAPPSVIVCVLYRNKGPLHPQVFRRWNCSLARHTSFVYVGSILVAVGCFLMWQPSRRVCLDSLGHPLLSGSVRYVFRAHRQAISMVSCRVLKELTCPGSLLPTMLVLSQSTVCTWVSSLLPAMSRALWPLLECIVVLAVRVLCHTISWPLLILTLPPNLPSSSGSPPRMTRGKS